MSYLSFAFTSQNVQYRLARDGAAAGTTQHSTSYSSLALCFLYFAFMYKQSELTVQLFLIAFIHFILPMFIVF